MLSLGGPTLKKCIISNSSLSICCLSFWLIASCSFLHFSLFHFQSIASCAPHPLNTHIFHVCCFMSVFLILSVSIFLSLSLCIVCIFLSFLSLYFSIRSFLSLSVTFFCISLSVLLSNFVSSLSFSLFSSLPSYSLYLYLSIFLGLSVLYPPRFMWCSK